MADRPDITIFICGGRRRSNLPRCTSCGAAAELACSYPLRGARAGETCGRAVCARCAVPMGSEGSEPLCAPHRRLVESEGGG